VVSIIVRIDKASKGFGSLFKGITRGIFSLNGAIAGEPEHPVALDSVFDALLALVAERDPDFYEVDVDALKRV
jgi:hypothetical protein